MYSDFVMFMQINRFLFKKTNGRLKNCTALGIVKPQIDSFFSSDVMNNKFVCLTLMQKSILYYIKSSIVNY